MVVTKARISPHLLVLRAKKGLLGSWQPGFRGPGVSLTRQEFEYGVDQFYY